jgi:uncharacterized protein (TIGR03084 family)
VADTAGILADLRAEGDALDAVVATRPQLDRPTPAPGWTIGHQVGHLAWTDHVALLAVTDPERFVAEAIASAAAGDTSAVDAAAAEWAARPDLLADWRSGRAALADALAALPDGHRLPWFGPPMGVASMATARLMETWAHGQDVVDALDVERAPTSRLRHVAHIGVRTRDFAYVVRGAPPPEQPFRVELTAPSGPVWTWGPDDAAQRVTGPALDFALLVTQRRHRDDLAVVAEGADADHWLDIAQAFAGPPAPGRPRRDAS